MGSGLSQEASRGRSSAAPATGGGGGSTDAMSRLGVVTGDTTTTTDAVAVLGRVGVGDAVTTTEAVVLGIRGPADATTTTEVLHLTARYFAGAATDNDSSRTTPANAVGTNNATFAKVSTNLQTADTANPVVLTATTFGVPSTGLTPVAARAKVWFKAAARTSTSSDTAKLTLQSGVTTLVLTQLAGTAAVDFTTTPLTVTLPMATWTLPLLAAAQVLASYQATVVLVPETALMVDAIAIELDLA